MHLRNFYGLYRVGKPRNNLEFVRTGNVRLRVVTSLMRSPRRSIRIAQGNASRGIQAYELGP